MKRITRVRARLRRLNRRRVRLLKSIQNAIPGSPEALSAKKALAKVEVFIKRRKRDIQLIRAARVNWNGHPPLPLLRREVRVCLKHNLYVTSTWEGYPGDGVHTNSSYHYQKRAVDIGGSYTDLVAAQNELVKKFGYSHFTELFGPAPFWVKTGTRYGGVFTGHHDHIHIAR